MTQNLLKLKKKNNNDHDHDKYITIPDFDKLTEKCLLQD